MKMKMMKKAFTIFAAAAMLLSPFGLASQFAAIEVYADDSYNLWVGEEEVTTGNTQGAGWTFTPSPDGGVLGTLTLTDATITKGHSAGGVTSGIYNGGTDVLNIVADGDNSIKAAQGENQLTYGILSAGGINISGSGSLSAEGESAGIHTSGNTADITINGGTISSSATGNTGIAIHSSRHIDIEGGSVEATGSNVGILASGEVELKGGSVTASGGKQAIDSGSGYEVIKYKNVVVWAGSSESDAEDVTDTFVGKHNQKWVQTETVTLWVAGIPVTSRNAKDILGDLDEGASASYDAGKQTLTLNNYGYVSDGYKFINVSVPIDQYAAIYAEQKLTIRLEGDNTVKCKKIDNSIGNGIHVAGEDGDLIIIGNGTLTASAYGNEQGDAGVGIYARNGDIEFNGGTVNALGDNGIGISTDKKEGYVRINSGIVTASGDDRGFSGSHVTVAHDMGINAGDSKETATGVDKGKFETYHPQHWVQVAKAYPLWVRGIWVMVTNKDDVLGDGKASFDPDTNTLSLEGANITADAVYQKENAAIYYEDEDNDLIIDSTKDSIVKGPESDNSNDESYGIFSRGPVVLKGNLTVVGATRAIDALVKNSAIGLGWTNTEGTEGKKEFKINEQGQDLGEDIRKVVFPAPKASVSKAPVGKSLTYNGSAQELVAAGAAEDGAMKYALGKDADTAPTEGWSSSIPVGTDAGDYFVWYRAEGDATHIDSEPGCVMVTIAAVPEPEPTPEKPVIKPTIKKEEKSETIVKPEPIEEKEEEKGEVKASPKTGDESGIAGWILLLIFVVAATGVVARRRLRQK